MKTVGLIDYYLSEWHANNYPAWIERANGILSTDYRVGYAWGELEVSPVDGVTGTQWCENNRVTYCKTLAEVCEKSDVIMILAPTNPETHLRYAKEVFPFGKPTYVDKTFAENADQAKEIFELAKRFGVPMFSTSALRYADELKEFSSSVEVTVTGGGRTSDEYIIHQAEMAVMLLGEEAKKVQVYSQGRQKVFAVETVGGKHALIPFAHRMPYTVTAEMENGDCKGKAVRSDFFANLLTEIVRFFESGIPPVSEKETLTVMQWRDLMLQADHADRQK